MATLTITGLKKCFGDVTALDDVSLTVPHGAFVSVIGGSGCGKTTLLRCIGGFATADAGTIMVQGRNISALPPHRRDIGFVFQSYALFPTMTVAGNIGFGLRVRGAGRAVIARRVADLAALVGLSGMLERFPHELSGGQQQRVALARALAPEPPVLLLDEPLSALDAQTRESLREELRAILARLAVTTLYVTHDQHEALSLSDSVVVMQAGRVLQQATPQEVYLRPACHSVAAFLGRLNAVPDGRGGIAHVRPEHVGLTDGADAVVEALRFTGPTLRATLRRHDGVALEADVPAREAAARQLSIGQRVGLAITPADVTTFPA